MKKRFKIPLYLLSFLLLACLIFWGLITQTRLLEQQVNRLLRVFVQNRYSVRVEVGDISGPFWRELRVQDITVDLVKEGNEYRMASIPDLKVNYHLSNLWRKKWILDSLIVDRPSITIQKTQEGKTLLPSSPKRKIFPPSGLFDFKVGHLKINEGVFNYTGGEKQSTIDSLNLELSLSKDKEGIKADVLNGEFTYIQKDFPIRQFSGSFIMVNDSLSINEMKIKTVDSDLDISGSIHNLQTPEFSLSIQATPVNLDDIQKLTGVGLEGLMNLKGTCEGDFKKFGGKADLDGTFFERKFEQVKAKYSFQNKKLTFPFIQGRVFGSPLNGNGELDLGKKPEEYQFAGTVSHLDLNQIIFGSLHTDLSGYVSFMGRSFSDKEMVMEAEVNIQKGRIEQYTFSAASGIMDITNTAIVFHPQFLVDYKNTQVDLSGELQYEGDVDIDASVSFLDLKDFWYQIFIKQMAGRGKATLKLSGKTADFDIRGTFLSDSCYVYQLYSTNARVDLSLANFITKPQGEVDIQFLRGNAWGVVYDSLNSRMEVDGEWIKIDTTRLSGKDYDVNLWGELDASKTPQTLILHQVVLDYKGNRLQTFSPTVVDVDTEKAVIRKFILSGETGEVGLSGTMDFEEKMSLTVDVSDLAIAPWAVLMTPEPIEGKFSAQVALEGDFQNPRIGMKGQIEALKFRGMELGNLSTELVYNDKKLEVNKLDVLGSDWEYQLSGYLPLDLSFYATEKRVLDTPQSFKIQVQGKRLELIRWFIPDVEYLTGDMQGDLDISGSLFHPQFDGGMTIKNGSLKFAELSDPVEDLNVEMRMQNENLILDRVSGFMEHGESESGNFFWKIWRVFFKKRRVRGEVNGFGTINLKDIDHIDYDLYFSGDKVPVNYEYADLSATADFSVQIAGRTLPLVSAQIMIPQLYYREPFSSSGSGSESSLTPSYPEEGLWDWDFDITIPNNCWIINNDVNLELKGDLKVLRESGELKILGSMETIRGKYFLYGTTFNIESGTFTFDNIKEINPKIDLVVSSRLGGGAPSSSGTGSLVSTGTTNQIELAIKGTILEPEVEPASGSSFSQEDIVELLAFQRGPSSVDSTKMGSPFQERVLKSLGGAYSSRFLENIAGQSLGVETFEITPAWNQKMQLTDAQITVGKYVSDKIYFRYSRNLSQSSGQETGVEYRLSKNLLLEGSRDKQGLFHFGLNLNWEY
jgi:autotransporter translocation and assembly factor TamB